MRIAIFGAGGVGGYFGGRLAEAGEDVTFIARGKHLEAMRERGLRVGSIKGDFQIHPVRATDDPASVAPVDAVLLCVKAWQIREAAEAMRPLVGGETLVVPLENGVEAPDEIAEVLGAGHAAGGLCRVLAYITGPGEIRHSAIDPSLSFGELDGTVTRRVEQLRDAFARCRGVAVDVPPDIRVAMWTKFLFIAPVSGIGAVTRSPIGVFREIPETRRMLVAAFEEIVQLAATLGVGLPSDAVQKTLAFTDGIPADGTASMQRDLMEGRPSELEAQVGAVVRLADRAGIEVPVHRFLYAALLPQERRARGGR
ncbi:MAG TPA: 2-dehydropantoate 2-reductase [Gemmatimonadales bacterium]|nr:2-dehydropantoate 2-reductase [Gemmatimonadales bacterium]